MIKKIYIFFLIFSFCFFSISLSKADFQEKLINKYKNVNTLHFDFTQKIGDKIEFGSCHIKYPLLMKCTYPKKKKSIIANGKKFAIVKKRYKKIYFYPLKKTPLFYLLNKDNILNIIKNNKPDLVDAKFIQYKLVNDNLNTISIFFDRSTLNLSGWKTIDSYSNEVSFLLRNIETNVFIENKIFKIPKEEDL